MFKPESIGIPVVVMKMSSALNPVCDVVMLFSPLVTWNIDSFKGAFSTIFVRKNLVNLIFSLKVDPNLDFKKWRYFFCGGEMGDDLVISFCFKFKKMNWTYQMLYLDKSTPSITITFIVFLSATYRRNFYLDNYIILISNNLSNTDH